MIVNSSKFELPCASVEQSCVIDSILGDANVRLVSVAGSGKTTLSLMCIRALLPRGYRTLILTYNANLKTETRRKVEMLGVSEVVEVHSFHSFGTKYWNSSCRTDEALDSMVTYLREGGKLLNDPVFDFVIIDEAQDITPLYWDIITLLASLCGRECDKRPPQFLIIGDPRQSIYEYKGASPRYLTDCETLLPSGGREWHAHSLHVTWRLTPPMASFVNNAFLGGEDVLTSGHAHNNNHVHSKRPSIKLCNLFGTCPTDVIFELLQHYRPDQIMILAPTIKKGISRDPKKRTPLRILEGRLLQKKIPVCVNDVMEDCSLSEEVLRNKLAFMTFHGSKGSERDAVVVMGGTDDAYPLFFNRNATDNEDVCPNPVYVSMTRAKRELIIIHGHNAGFAPYVNMSCLSSLCDIDTNKYNVLASREKKIHLQSQIPVNVNTKRDVSVSSLLEHMPYHIIKKACESIRWSKKTLSSSLNVPELSATVKTLYGAEYVADLNGIAIPAMLQHRLQGRCWLLDQLHTLNLESSTLCKQLREHTLARYAEDRVVCGDFLCGAMLHQSARSQYFYRARQLPNFRWIDACTCDALLSFLQHEECGINESMDPEFEVPMVREYMGYTIHGEADVILRTDQTLIELKCTSGDFEMKHMLQAVFYGWMQEPYLRSEIHTVVHSNVLRYPLLRVVYVLSGHIYEIERDSDAFESAIRCVIQSLS